MPHPSSLKAPPAPLNAGAPYQRKTEHQGDQQEEDDSAAEAEAKRLKEEAAKEEPTKRRILIRSNSIMSWDALCYV